MIILTKLILAHLLGDFVFQPGNWVKDKIAKTYRSPFLYLHVLIHGVLMLLFLGFSGTLLPIITIVLLHLLIDLVKLFRSGSARQTMWFLVDQLLHFVTILVVWYLWIGHEMFTISDLPGAKILIWVTAVVFLTRPMSFIIAQVLTPFSSAIPDARDHSLAQAGTYIGMIERLFVFGLIVSNHWEAMGLLIAAKSVFRFGDLQGSKSRKLTEYVLIGTLISFGSAILTGVLVQEILNGF